MNSSLLLKRQLQWDFLFWTWKKKATVDNWSLSASYWRTNEFSPDLGVPFSVSPETLTLEQQLYLTAWKNRSSTALDLRNPETVFCQGRPHQFLPRAKCSALKTYIPVTLYGLNRLQLEIYICMYMYVYIYIHIHIYACND